MWHDTQRTTWYGKNFSCIWQQYNSVYDKLDLWTFQYTDHYGQHWETDTDLGNHFCSNISDNCCYCSDEQFNHTWIKMISILFNSLYSNVDNIKESVQKTFQHCCDFWNMEKRKFWMGMKVLNRRNKNGGRIAVNVDKTYLLLVINCDW